MRFAHITLGKAGSQWIKDVLSDPDIFGLQTGLRFFRPDKGGTYGMSQFAHEADGTVAAPIYEVTYDDWKQYAGPTDRCLVVLRDPRDSIVSWGFSIAYSHVTEEHVRIVRPALLALDLRGKLEVAMYTFWESAKAQRSWAARPRTQTEFVLKYEDVIADEHKAFRDILDFFGWVAPEDVLAKVVNRLSFKTRSGRKPGEKQEFSHYRNGVAGDWKNYFDRDLGRRFEEACPGLLVEMGYERVNDWWESLPEDVPGLSEGAMGSKSDIDRLERRVVGLERKNELLTALAKERMEALEEALALAETLVPKA
ncbi:MAG TPA: sulfotransferase domain-containing protein [Candidatus Baltobacteraceae bacterium]